mmetsp:Transcript_352/g.1035  ORF Transcript_352/g.1035 Transcript_352/m.1035 type:complete len:217 (+) Transcript_352:3-653(+)
MNPSGARRLRRRRRAAAAPAAHRAASQGCAPAAPLARRLPRPASGAPRRSQVRVHVLELLAPLRGAAVLHRLPLPALQPLLRAPAARGGRRGRPAYHLRGRRVRGGRHVGPVAGACRAPLGGGGGVWRPGGAAPGEGPQGPGPLLRRRGRRQRPPKPPRGLRRRGLQARVAAAGGGASAVASRPSQCRGGWPRLDQLRLLGALGPNPLRQPAKVRW